MNSKPGIVAPADPTPSDPRLEPMASAMTEAMAQTMTQARAAQAAWSAVPLRERLRRVRILRALIARDGAILAAAAGQGRSRPAAETLTAEIIPLAAACAFLEGQAVAVLRTRHIGRRGRPWWLNGVRSQIRREPFGVVLIVAPANYPLLLSGVQLIQAVVAGNAALVKPGRGGDAAMRALLRLMGVAGFPGHLLQVLPEPPAQVHLALEAGCDLVVFTGSTAAGRRVLEAAAAHAIPVIAELSGDDPAIIRADADPALAASALRFANELNGGDSCIAPRRIIAAATIAGPLRSRAPGLAVEAVADDAAALARAGASPFALGASIFSGDEAAALRLAGRLNAGVVVINDCIMPTADPRLPFGGRAASGHGVTRGAEGLLALTRPKTIVIQRGPWLHLRPGQDGDADFFLAYLQAAHGRGWRHRWQWVRRLLRLAKARRTS